MSTPSPAPAGAALNDILHDVAGMEGGSLCSKRLGKYLALIEKVTIDNAHFKKTSLNGTAPWYANRVP